MSWTRDPGWGVVDRPEEADHGGVLYAADLSTGEILRLEGPTAVIARAALAGHGHSGIRQSAAQELGVSPADIDEEVTSELLAELERLGLLRQKR